MQRLALVLLSSCSLFCAAQEKPAPPAKAAPASAAKTPISSARALEMARKQAATFLTGDAASLWPLMTPEMKAALKDDPKNLAATQQSLASQLGTESKVLREVVLPVPPDYQSYARESTYSNVPIKMVLSLSYDGSGQIAGFYITQEGNPAESKYTEYKTKAALQLPFRGEWTVYQGGRSVFENYHAAYPDERFAYDLTVIKNGTLWQDDANKLDSYFAYGQPILAPADGKVVAAVDAYDDNPVNKPSSTSPKQGNNIVIDHGNGEFSMMAHLKRGSVKVKVGDQVKAGQQIAQCGNSGNSPFPHLHYHLQTTPDWFKGDGLPTQFAKYTSDGKPASGEPAKGQVISNP